jgi:transposase
MLKKAELQQQELELVSLEGLVPEKHLLRKVEQVVDFGFIRDRVKHLYCEDNGRPALDPVVLFKLLLLGYLYGVRSERQLMRDVEVNVAYRWFLGLKLRDKVPDASTLSQNRRRRFSESTIYQEIFDEIVLLAVQKGLASGAVLYTDSTHLKANAQQEQVRPGPGSGQAAGVPGCSGCGDRRRPRGAWQEAAKGFRSGA